MFKFWGALITAALAAMPAAAEQVVVERDTALYAEPRLESAQVAQLKKGADGEVIGKSGAWLNLKLQGVSGWLLSFNVRFQVKQAEAAESAKESGSALGRLFGPRRSVNVTSTIGIRGLEEDDLRQASFSAEQMRQLEQYAATREAAAERAHAAGLAAERVEYLDGRPQ